MVDLPINIAIAIGAGLGLALAMVLTSYAGHRLARSKRDDPRTSPEAFTLNTSAVFALFGLLVAFTFSGAYSRYELRRRLIVEEANSIGTAYLRIDMLPADAQPALRADFHAYAENRAAFFDALPDQTKAGRNLAEGQVIQQRIWRKVIDATSDPAFQSSRISVLPALNQMIDISTTRTATALAHPPLIVFAMLATVALACAWLTGYGAGKQDRLSVYYAGFFAVLAGFMLYVILEIEFPSRGLVNLSDANQFLRDLRQQM